VDADTQRLGEAYLGQANKSTKRHHVVTGLELAGHETLSYSGWNRPGKLTGSEFGKVAHR
jgi:hypothetical protein